MVNESLIAASPTGYRLLQRTSRGVERVFDHPVPHGPLDNGAHLQLWTLQGDPGTYATILIEVKNIREWVYAESAELHQLLTKAALIQQKFPDKPLLPILVCRRANKTAFRAAKTLGFLVIDTRRQYLLPRASLDHSDRGDRQRLQEVRQKLGFLDLIVTEGPDPVVTKMFTNTLPSQIPKVPDRWRQLGCRFDQHYRALWQSTSEQEREEIYADLRTQIREEIGEDRLGW